MLPRSESARWALAVGAGCLVLIAINLWWVFHFRDGYPLDVDEAGYTSIGLIDFVNFKANGLHGWWEAVQNQTPNAPLLPTLTSVLLVVKPGVMAGFVVLIGFGALLTFAAYGIGERLAGPRLGALAALAVATSQGAFIYTREYVFALPTAAFLLGAVFCLMRSDGMRARRWAILTGVCVGLMLLSRTMAVAFVPGIVVAALLLVITRGWGGDLGRRLLNFGLAVLAGFLVAITWYWKNLDPVLDYLTSFGYGSQSQYYGAEHAFISWGRFKTVVERMLFDDLLAPLAVLVFIGLLATGVVLVRRLVETEDRRAELIRIAGTDALTILLVFLAGYGALMSSRNGGNGFTFPLAMLLPPLAVIALRYYRVALAPAAALVAAIAAVNVVAHLDLWKSASEPQRVSLPVFGETPWVNGIPHAVDAIRVQSPGSEFSFDERDKGWREADEELADLFLSPVGPGNENPFVAFASRNRAISSNSVGMAALLNHRTALPMTQLVAEPTDTVANYEHQLTDPAFGQPTGLVAMSSEAGDFEPLVTQSFAETAARNLGFVKIREFPLPDGRTLRFWVKRSAGA
ncbi:MAG TPA: glycosyltransferase family 39 protein [Solirubrobacterales bacterium]|nr:glycosyltransferase family 39 protein [Solirubrobacterales bacterium]